MFVLDPRFEVPQWVVRTQAISSLRVQLYQVEPRDYFAFSEYEAGTRATPPGKKVYDHNHPVGARHGAVARIDLRPALSASGSGHVIAVATATPARERLAKEERRRVVEGFEITVRNHKKEAVTVKVLEKMYRGREWRVPDTNHNFERLDGRTIVFPVRVPPDGEQTIRYQVEYRW